MTVAACRAPAHRSSRRSPSASRRATALSSRVRRVFFGEPAGGGERHDPLNAVCLQQTEVIRQNPDRRQADPIADFRLQGLVTAIRIHDGLELPPLDSGSGVSPAGLPRKGHDGKSPANQQGQEAFPRQAAGTQDAYISIQCQNPSTIPDRPSQQRLG